MDSSGEFGGRPPLQNPRIERVFFEVGEIVEIVKKKHAHATRRDAIFIADKCSEGREGKRFFFFFFCGGKGAYAAGLPTDLPKPIDQLDAVGIR